MCISVAGAGWRKGGDPKAFHKLLFTMELIIYREAFVAADAQNRLEEVRNIERPAREPRNPVFMGLSCVCQIHDNEIGQSCQV